MKDHVAALLQQAEIRFDENISITEICRFMEIWIGVIDDDDSNSTPYIEDDCPLSEEVILKLGELLQFVWNPNAMTVETPIVTSDSSLTNNSPSAPPVPLFLQNPLLDCSLPADQISLDAVFPSFRVARWFRHMMDLRLDTNRSLCQRLFDSSLGGPVVHALYLHIQDLPRLQAQMHRYTRSLQQTRSVLNNDTRTAGSSSRRGGIVDPKVRLEQYADAAAVSQRLLNEWSDHMDRLKILLGEFYLQAPAHSRSVQRTYLGSIWTSFIVEQSSTTTGSPLLGHENTKAAAIALTLSLLHRILTGIQSRSNNNSSSTSVTLHSSYVHMLSFHLIPLHQPNGLILWRDQIPVLELYHEPLTQCIAVLLQHQPTLISTVLMGLIQSEIFPIGNTPKQVLLLHEIDSYLGLFKNAELQQMILQHCSSDNDVQTSWFSSLIRRLATCMGSDHSRVAERALALFQNIVFLSLVAGQIEATLPILLPMLVKSKGEAPSWNPTVRKRTYNVLKILREMDEHIFRKICDELYPVHVRTTVQQLSSRSKLISPSQPEASIVPKDLSLKAGMGSWRPPSQTSSATVGEKRNTLPNRNRTPMPPPAARLPLTMQQQQQQQQHSPTVEIGKIPVISTSCNLPPSRGGAPPVTVTGVAPWALGSNALPRNNAVHTSKRSSLSETLDSMVEKETKPSTAVSGFDYVNAYMKLLQPVDENGDGGGASSWSQTQLAETPTLLPDLKFHDLVFGHELGSGAFGVIRYARLIDRTKTRSFWAEYAVKIIATDKIRELGYEASVQREISVLKILSHPGIARLVSSFRFKEGAYLVLEYASGGDLHQLLRKNGSLDHESTRFVVGELIAVLSSIHEIGLVYSDLKTENVLITETGHIKLTDMGACRPVTPQAIQAVRSISKDLLQNLRDGGWKPDSSRDDCSATSDVDNGEEDNRIEGTTSFLPPEVVVGGVPTYAADAWALGCLTYQCLTGRPPFLEDDEEATRHRIVSFTDARVMSASNHANALFNQKHSEIIEASAQEMIECLLTSDFTLRPTMQELAEFRFFSETNMDVFSLYRKSAYPLDIGKITPAPDAKWSRRQYSSIWAPQPASYDLSLVAEKSSRHAFGNSLSASSPIHEGEEGSSYFSASASNRPMNRRGVVGLRQISEVG